MNLLDVTNRLDTYCRFILKGEMIGEYMVNDGFKHKDILNIADENNIEFDLAMLYYKYKGLEEYRFNFYENQFGSYGRDKLGEKEYLINNETNLVIGDFENVESS